MATTPARLISPFLPAWAREGTTIIKVWDEPYQNSFGRKAMVTKVRFKLKKNGSTSEIEMVKWVKWLN
ncbi:hypothetical protein ACI2KR_31015 [Pseudomonas luteola]